MNLAITIIYYIGITLICLLTFKKNLKRDIKELKTNIKTYLTFIIKKLGITYIIYIIVSIICVILTNKTTSVNQQTLLKLPMVILIPLAVIYAPIVEECIFRGCIRRFIKNDKLFIVISALTFGLIHTVSEATLLNSIIMMLPYATLEAGLAYIYNKTNNITTNMISHFLINTFVLISELPII